MSAKRRAAHAPLLGDQQPGDALSSDGPAAGGKPRIARMYGGTDGHPRNDHDFYRTPPWVTELLCKHVQVKGRRVWEPACGDGDMADELKRHGADVVTSDVRDVVCMFPKLDFLSPLTNCFAHSICPDLIVTNPPFKVSADFVSRALEITERDFGMVAMLLPYEWDAATTERGHLLRHPAFDCRIVLGRRISWVGMEINERTGKKAAPRQVHCWMIWDWSREPGRGGIIYA